MNRLLLERELNDPLSYTVESTFAAELDDLWYAMTAIERKEVERYFERTVPAPESLGLVDIELTLGTSQSPRTAG